MNNTQNQSSQSQNNPKSPDDPIDEVIFNFSLYYYGQEYNDSFTYKINSKA